MAAVNADFAGPSRPNWNAAPMESRPAAGAFAGICEVNTPASTLPSTAILMASTTMPPDAATARALAFDFGLLCVLDGLTARMRAAAVEPGAAASVGSGGPVG